LLVLALHAYPSVMPRVFISYSHKDRLFVENLVANLELHHVAVRGDWEIGPGDSILHMIEEGIDESDFLLVILSESSVTSKWVQEELKVAIRRTIETGFFVIPVLLEVADIPMFLADRRYADFTGDRHQAFSELLQAIKQEKPIYAKFVEGQERVAGGIVSSILAKRFANEYESATPQRRLAIEREVQEEFSELQAQFQIPEDVFPIYMRICLTEKRVLYPPEVISRLPAVLEDHPEDQEAVVSWLLGIVVEP
jgi:hypothetical protein